MCHFLLATRQRSRGQERFFGNYGDEVIEYLTNEFLDHDISPDELTAGVYGGGSFQCLTSRSGKAPIGSANLEIATRLLKAHGIKGLHEHAGGAGYRRVTMSLRTGMVAVKFTSYTA